MTYEAEPFEALWPLAPREAGDVPEHERSGSLSGLRVAYIWDELFRGPEMFDVITETARERYGDDVTFVGWENFGNFHAGAAAERRVLDALPGLLRTHRVDLVVAAVGA